MKNWPFDPFAEDNGGSFISAADLEVALDFDPGVWIRNARRNVSVSTWYKDVLTELPMVKNGYIEPLDGAGLGTRLLPELTERPGVQTRRSML